MEYPIFVVSFCKQEGEPKEEYYYPTEEQAREHFNLFVDDDSELYTAIDLIKLSPKEEVLATL